MAIVAPEPGKTKCLVQRAASGNREETAMDRKLDDVGHGVETESGCGLISGITYAAPSRGEGGKIGADVKGRIALQVVLKKAAAAVGNGIHDRTNEITAYARRGPVGA